MRRILSKDSLVDLAQHAVGTIRKIVSSDGWGSRDVLFPSARAVESACRMDTKLDPFMIEEWVSDFTRHLSLQTTRSAADSVAASEGKGDTYKPLSESGLLACFELVHLLTRSCNSTVAIDIYRKRKLISAFTAYYMNAWMTKRVRDLCAQIIFDLTVKHESFVDELLHASIPYLRAAGTTSTSTTSADQGNASSILRILLGSLLVTILHSTTLVSGMEIDIDSYNFRVSVIDDLLPIAYQVVQTTISDSESSHPPLPKSASPLGVEAPGLPYSHTADEKTNYNAAKGSVSSRPASGDLSSTASDQDRHTALNIAVVYFTLISALYRGVPSLKKYVRFNYSYKVVRLWATMANLLPQLQISFPLPCSTKPATTTLEPIEYWQSELLDALMELCTNDSFSYRCTAVIAASTAKQRASTPVDRSVGDSSPAGHSSATTANGGPSSQLKLISPDWDLFLSSGSTVAWKLTSSLFTCNIQADAVVLLRASLLELNTKCKTAEALYREIVAVLTLLCAANPQNVVTLCAEQFVQTLISLVTYSQPTVFFESTNAQLSDKTEECTSLELVPTGTLSTTTTQLTFSLLHTLASVYFSKTMMSMFKKGVEDMQNVASCQTDVDVMETLLFGFTRLYIPHPILFFPGNGHITWRLRNIYPRGTGYSFVSWIYPTSVWERGSCLFSFTDQNETRVSIVLIANGRQCGIAVRVAKAGSEPVECFLRDSSFVVPEWSHIAVCHGVALNVYLNGCRLESMHDVPYPKEKTSLVLNLGGTGREPSFFGFTSGLAFSSMLSEKEVVALHAAGPNYYDAETDCASVLIPTAPKETHVEMSPFLQKNIIAKKSTEFSWKNVELYLPTDLQGEMTPSVVIEWVLGLFQSSRISESAKNTCVFMNITKLGLNLLSNSMRLANHAQLMELVTNRSLDRLQAEVSSWDLIFAEFASTLLHAVTPRNGGKVLYRHECTQQIFDVLLHCVVQWSEKIQKEGDVAVHGVCAAARCTSINVVLRELSDCLLVRENLAMFQTAPSRFTDVLRVSLQLPKECIKSVVILIEKLCRGGAELQQVLLFLFTPSSETPTATLAKIGVLRMLFDIARDDVGMCEMILDCFKGRGLSFILMLINGKNHNSEAIRVLALGLLSLMIPLKGCNRVFRKSDGFDILSLAITDQRRDIPLGIRTFDALFQIAFDEYRSPKEKRPEVDSITSRLLGSAHIFPRSRHRDVSSSLTSSPPARSITTSKGYTPSILVSHFTARRGFSFEHTHDFGRVNDDVGEMIITHKGSSYQNLQLPLALKTVLSALGCLIQVGLHRLNSPLTTTTMLIVPVLASPTPTNGDGLKSPSTRVEHSPVDPSFPLDEDRVVIEVLNYLEKVIDLPKHAKKLIEISWLDSLWSAVRIFFERYPDGVATSQSGKLRGSTDGLQEFSLTSSASRTHSDSAVHRLHLQKSEFVASVTQRTRTIIRKMVILDITENEKASIRCIRDGEHPQRLVRLVLEEIVRHFSHGKNSELGEDANNVIRNLNSLFREVQYALSPFPSALGIGIVMAITTIAVSSNTQVRRHMKNNSNLFSIRDNLAFFVLRETRRFSRLGKRLLSQLLDANVNSSRSVTVLLNHLCTAIKENNVNEVEVLVLLIQQLSTSDAARRRELFTVVGDSDNARVLAELLSSNSAVEAQSPLLAAPLTSLPTPSERGISEMFTDGDSAAGIGEGVSYSTYGFSMNPLEHDGDLGSGRCTTQVLEWCSSNKEEWESVQRSIRASMASIIAARREDRMPNSKSNRQDSGFREKSCREFNQMSEEVDAVLVNPGGYM